MKVLKKGRKQKGWSKEYNCTGKGNGNGGCGAKLLVEQADLFITSSHCRDETDNFVTFKCMSCGVLTDIPANDYPRSQELPDQKAWEYARRPSTGDVRD